MTAIGQHHGGAEKRAHDPSTGLGWEGLDSGSRHPPRADRSSETTGTSTPPHAGQAACPECGTRTVAENYELVCRHCGLVVSERRIQRDPERHDDESPAGRGRRRCNGAPARASRNPGWARTTIGTYAEREQASSTAVGFHRLERLHTQASDYETEVLNHALPEIKRVCSAIDLRGDTVERACGIFRQARSAGFLQNRRIETVAGAAVYGTCREHRIPRLPGDVAGVLRVTSQDLNGSTSPVEAMLRAFRGLCKADGVTIRPYPLTPLAYVPRFASALDVPAPTRRLGRAIARVAVEADVAPNRAPGCVAGAALGLAISSTACDVTYRDVADGTGYAVETLRAVRQTLEDAAAVEEAIAHSRVGVA